MEQRAAFLHAVLRILEERTIGLASQQRQELLERDAAIAHETDLNRIAKAEAHRIELYLHRARGARFGVVLDIREGAADDE
jgi:hypothetical protein